jgi:hypothetical protein
MLKPGPTPDETTRMLLHNGQSVADRLAQANDMEQALRLVMYRYRRKLAPWPPRVIETIRQALREG